MKILGDVDSKIDNVSKAIGLAACFMVYFMTFIVTYEVIMRYFLVRPSLWVLDVSCYCLIFMSFMGFGYALLRQVHIRVEVITQRLSRRAQILIDLISLPLVVVLFALPYIYVSIPIFLQFIRTGHAPMGGIELPYWWVFWMVPVGMLLLSFQIISELVKLRREYKSMNKARLEK